MRYTIAVIAVVLLLTGCAQQSTRTWQLPSGVNAVRVNGYDMAYVEQGTGTPVVLIHGAMNDLRYFTQALDLIAVQHRAIAVSLRHYYPEPWDGKGSTFSMRQHVADVAAFIRERKLAPAHVVGHSRGGTVALYVATLHPGLVRSLVFAEGGANMPAFDASIATTQPISHRGMKTLALFEQGKVEEGLAYFMDDAGGPGSWNRASELSRQIYRDNAWTVKGAVSDAFDPYTCADARRVRGPVLLLSGQKSPPFRAKTLDALQACVTTSERGVVANAAHSMVRDNPRGFSEAVLAFLAKH